jgi:Uma2 family endonuclease
MTAERTTWPDDRPLTVEDLELLPDDGNRYELDDGVLVVSPAPAISHQVVVSRLTFLLMGQAPAGVEVIAGPGVEMSRVQYRIPDLIVARVADFDLAAKSVTRAPEIAIEVASPSTALYDRNRKKTVYAEFGIPRYWIVAPSLEQPSLTAFALRGGVYEELARVVGDEVFRTDDPFPIEIIPAQLVARRRP